MPATSFPLPASRPTTLRAGAVCGAALLLVTCGAGAAFAHVTVSPEEAAAGSYATLTFKVPNESATASTTAVEVALPTDTPFTSVSVEPVPGWTAQVTTRDLPEPATVHGTEVTEAPATVVWTADDADAAIDPGEFRRFTISAGAVPEGVDQLALPATQTYSDGEVVAWDEVPAADGDEPEHPAPTLAVVPAADGGHHGTATGTQERTDEGADGTSDPWVLGLAATGLGLGLVGAVTGVVALVRTSGRRDR